MSLLLRKRLPQALAPLAGALLLLGAAPRRAVDEAAMREAMEAAAAEDAELSSSSSYAHFLESRLRHHAGDARGAIEALRQAQASDDGSVHLRLRLAAEHARLGQRAAAERELRAVLALAPEQGEARVMLGRVLLEAGRLAAAEAQLRRALQLRPHEPSASLVLAQLYLEKSEPKRAVEVMEAVHPTEVAGRRRLALALAARGEAGLAAPLLERVLSQVPQDAEGWRTLGALREQTGAPEAAAAAYARALACEPEAPQSLLAAGSLALRRGQPAEARTHFERLLALGEDPERVLGVASALVAARSLDEAVRVLDGARARGLRDGGVAFYAGLVHERRRDYARAAAAFAEVPPDDDSFDEARLHRASCLSRSGAHAQALELLGRALAQRPEDAALQVAHARALERSGDVAGAEAALRRALRRAPPGPLYLALAEGAARSGSLAQARRVLEEGLARLPREVSLLFALARAQQAAGEGARAAGTLQRLLELSPQHTGAMGLLARVLAEHPGSLQRAEHWVRRALAREPEAGPLLDTLGEVYLRRGEPERAAEVLTRAAARAPELPRIHEHLGDALSAAGRAREAEGAYLRALAALEALDPEAGEPAGPQRAALERKLKMLSSRASGD